MSRPYHHHHSRLAGLLQQSSIGFPLASPTPVGGTYGSCPNCQLRPPCVPGGLKAFDQPPTSQDTVGSEESISMQQNKLPAPLLGGVFSDGLDCQLRSLLIPEGWKGLEELALSQESIS